MKLIQYYFNDFRNHWNKSFLLILEKNPHTQTVKKFISNKIGMYVVLQTNSSKIYFFANVN